MSQDEQLFSRRKWLNKQDKHTTFICEVENMKKKNPDLQLKNSETLKYLNFAMSAMSMNILREDGIKIREIVFSVINISILVYALTFGVYHLLKQEDVSRMISSLTTFNIVWSVAIRLITLIVYSNEIRSLTRFIKFDFVPYYQNDKKHIQILEVNDVKTKIFFILFAVSLFSIIGSYIAYPTISSNKLIIPMEALGKLIPDHYEYSLIINFSYQCYALGYFFLIALCYDSIVILLMLNGVAFLDILLNTIKSNQINLESEDSIITYAKKLKWINKQHNLIMTFFYRLENVIKNQMTMQYVVDIVHMCTSIYSSQQIGLIFMFVSSMTAVSEIFVFCWLGNLLQDKSDLISNEIYLTNWEDGGMREKKTVCLMITFSNKTLILSTGFINLELLTFIQVLKTAYSFYTLLSNIDD